MLCPTLIRVTFTGLHTLQSPPNSSLMIQPPVHDGLGQAAMVGLREWACLLVCLGVMTRNAASSWLHVSLQGGLDAVPLRGSFWTCQTALAPATPTPLYPLCSCTTLGPAGWCGPMALMPGGLRSASLRSSGMWMRCGPAGCIA